MNNLDQQKTERTEMADRIKSACPEINDSTLQILAEMYTFEFLSGTEVKEPFKIDPHTRISLEQGAMMNSLMRKYHVKKSLEVGFAYGYSTMWMLDVNLNSENTPHVAIDPLEKTLWKGVGLKQVERLYPGVNFTWENDFSTHVLSRYIALGKRFDFTFIDGNHRFDDVIVDFYLADQLVEVGGLVVFDDMWMPAVQKATQFIVKNRYYKVIEQSVANILVLQKADYDYNRAWNHFVEF